MKPGMTWLQEAALRKPAGSDLPEPKAATLERAREAVSNVCAIGESRQAKWKRLNPGRVREAQKMLMRKRRAKQ